MAAHTEVTTFEGLAGDIDCALDWPENPPIGWALVLHPNPPKAARATIKSSRPLHALVCSTVFSLCGPTSGALVNQPVSLMRAWRMVRHGRVG